MSQIENHLLDKSNEANMRGSIAVDGITLDPNVVKITLSGLRKDGAVISEIFAKLGVLGVNVDIIVHDRPEDDLTMKLGFTIAKGDLGAAKKAISSLVWEKNYREVKVSAEGDLAKVSVVGMGMRNYAGVAGRTFSALASHDIDINMISTSEIKISVVIDEADSQKAMGILHAEFIERETVGSANQT